MTRTTPLLLLGLLAACSDLPEMMGPEADPVTQPPATELVAGDPILDAIERITPALDDRAFAGELVSALRNADADPTTVERLLVRLSSNADYGADADAIRLALVRR